MQKRITAIALICGLIFSFTLTAIAIETASITNLTVFAGGQTIEDFVTSGSPSGTPDFTFVDNGEKLIYTDFYLTSQETIKLRIYE